MCGLSNLTALAVVTARGGSKSIPRKNLALLAGKPLIQHSIEPALQSDRTDRVIVSTDDEEIARIATEAGADVPFLRPAELAQDDTPTLPVLKHLLDELQKSRGYRPDAVILLQPTSPLRTKHHIDESLAIFDQHRPDSVVSVVEVPHNFNPVSIMKLETGRLKPYLGGEGTRLLRRQEKPVVYARNGPAILISSVTTLMDHDSLYGETVMPYLMSLRDSLDIDAQEDLELAELLLQSGMAGGAE